MLTDRRQTIDQLSKIFYQRSLLEMSHATMVITQKQHNPMEYVSVASVQKMSSQIKHRNNADLFLGANDVAH